MTVKCPKCKVRMGDWNEQGLTEDDLWVWQCDCCGTIFFTDDDDQFVRCE